MKFILTKEHILKADGLIIGRCEENKAENIVVTIFDKQYHDKWFYLEFQINNGEKYSSERLDVVDGVITYPVPNSLLYEHGELAVQVVFRDATGVVWKSSTVKLKILQSICASEQLQGEHPDFITEAQKILDGCEQVIESEDARVDAENVRDENENSRVDNEQVRVDAETLRAEAETSRNGNETTRVNAENTRIANENIRVDNEEERIANENARQEYFNKVQALVIPDGSVSPDKTTFFTLKEGITNRCNANSQWEDGYLLSRDGVKTALSGFSLTDFIPVKPNEILLTPYVEGTKVTHFTICLYEADKTTVIGAYGSASQDKFANCTLSEDGKYVTSVLPDYEGVAYAKFILATNQKSSFMIISGTDTYPSEYMSYNYGSKADYELNGSVSLSKEILIKSSPLYNKKIVCEGDSIMESRNDPAVSTYNGGGWAKIIADKYKMTLQNNAVSGGTIAPYEGKHCISQGVAALDSDADYVIFDGGVNDFCVGDSGIPIGYISGYNSIDDTSTVLGALDQMCKDLINKFPTAKIGYVFNHKIFRDTDSYQTTWSNYKSQIKQVLNKWGIPFIDLEIQVPPLNMINNLKSIYTCNGDGWHPNAEGYKKFYVDKIVAWLESL